MIKVTGLIGSLRKESINRMVFNHYKEISSDVFRLEEGGIANIPLYNSDIDEPEAVKKLAEQISHSEAVIFFSPEYNYSVPAPLKNAIDWLSRSDLKPFDQKPAAIIGASPGNIGTARMQYHLRQIGVFLNIHFLNKPEVMIGQSMKKIEDGKINDESTVEFLKKHAGLFKDFIQSGQ